MVSANAIRSKASQPDYYGSWPLRAGGTCRLDFLPTHRRKIDISNDVCRMVSDVRLPLILALSVIDSFWAGGAFRITPITHVELPPPSAVVVVPASTKSDVARLLRRSRSLVKITAIGCPRPWNGRWTIGAMRVAPAGTSSNSYMKKELVAGWTPSRPLLFQRRARRGETSSGPSDTSERRGCAGRAP